MNKDRFDEFYILQTQAKNQEKRGQTATALKNYLKIINEYLPDTTFSFERAVLLLEKDRRSQEAKEICKLALQRLDEGDTRGDRQFFLDRLSKMNANQNKKSEFDFLHVMKDRRFIVAALLISFGALLLSLPFKLSKFVFIIGLAFTLYFLVQLVLALIKKLTIKWQSIAVLLSLVVTMVAAAQLPPPEWTNFFSVQGFDSSPISDQAQSQTQPPSEPSETTITEKDFKTLESMMASELALSYFNLDVADNQITLEVFLNPAVTADEAKALVASILLELNSIKGFDPPDNNSMGQLYKSVSTTITVYDSLGDRMLNGQVRRFNQKLSW